MRLSAWLGGLGIAVLSFAPLVEAQTRGRITDDRAPAVSTSTPVVRVTTQNPREINLGKPATFVISVANAGKVPASEVVIATTIPAHVEVTKSDPRPIDVEGQVYRFRVGDLNPGATERVTLVAVPRELNPVKLDTTVSFATSTRASLMVRRPLLKVDAQVTNQAVLGRPVKWTVLVTNTGDGPAENVVLTPEIVSGEIQSTALRRPIQVGTLRAGETKKFTFEGTGSRKGEVSARFTGTNPDGLKAEIVSKFRVLQPELALRVNGPQIQPIGRESEYEVRVTNPGDAPTGSTLVTVTIPTGLEITSAPQNGYNEEKRTLRWRITNVRPGIAVPLRFRAEMVEAGNQILNIDAKAEQIASANGTHTTAVISRPNLIVTVVNSQELTEVGDQIKFDVRIVNAGSKSADDLQIRVAMPDGMEAVASEGYTIAGGQVEFRPLQLASGQKTAVSFRARGNKAGDHRVRVLINTSDQTSDLVFEAAAFCYAEPEESNRRTARRSIR